MCRHTDIGIYSTALIPLCLRSSSFVWVRSVIVRIGLASLLRSEAEFSDVIGTTVLRVFLLVIHGHMSHLRMDFTSPEPKWFETGL
jgi:hypothetical protein